MMHYKKFFQVTILNELYSVKLNFCEVFVSLCRVRKVNFSHKTYNKEERRQITYNNDKYPVGIIVFVPCT